MSAGTAIPVAPLARVSGLHVERFGAGPDLVMVHGWSMHGGVWLDFALDLAAQFRVTLLDLPGHGGSGPLPEFSLDAVAELLAAVAPPRAVWLGWSLGALLALRVAEAWPERVAGLVLVAGSPRFVAAPDWPGVEPNLLAQVAGNLARDFHGTLRRFIALQTHGHEHARTLARRIGERLDERPPPDLAALQGGLAILQQADLRGVLRSQDRPALAILGGHDRLVPREAAAALAALSPTLEVRLLPTAAHLPFATHPADVAGLVSGFARRRMHGP